MDTKLDNSRVKSLKNRPAPYEKRDWKTEQLRKRAEKDAKEIIEEAGVREILREGFKSIREKKQK